MPVQMKNPHKPKFPIKVKTNKDLEIVVKWFMEDSSDVLKEQYKNKHTFHEKVKFFRFLGLVE